MTRAELEGLDREALILRAEAAGVTRARILTRPELVDELLLRGTADHATKQRSRGLFGRARDLVARAVERGLHLPDAADRIRSLGAPVISRSRAPAALPTVTLAEIYAAQGHRDRAVETLQGVLAREPDHAAARALLTQLEDTTYLVPSRAFLGGEPEVDSEVRPPAASADPREPEADDLPREPLHMLDDAPLPTRYDVDECVAIPVDPWTLYVYWEVRGATLDYVRASRSHGRLALRIVVVVPTWDGPRSRVRDEPVDATLGDFFVRDLPAGCVVRAAIGWLHDDAFLPIAHSPALETPPGGPSPLVADVLVRWTPKGTFRVRPDDQDALSIERALGRVRREAARTRQAGLLEPGTEPFGGSSEQWAGTESSY